MSWMNPRSWLSGNPGAEAELDRILDEARRDKAELGGQGLSAASRARILAEALQPRPARAFWPPLFTPTGRVLAAGTLPLALAAGLMALVDRTGVPSPVTGAKPPTVEVAKVGDRVEFKVSNGGRAHWVSRSTEPDQFPKQRVRIPDGAFADDLEDDAKLVFYRIE